MNLKKDILIKNNASIKDAMIQLNETGESCLLVVNNKENFLGTITDGDIRRNLIKDTNINSSIKKIYNSNSQIVREKDFQIDLIKDIMLNYKIDLVPIISSDRKVINFFSWEEIFKYKKVKNEKFKKSPQLVIMAGGKGSRLKPFTDILPKPLIPFENKTIIESILDNFQLYGVKSSFITINYKSRIIKSYFEELDVNYKVKFIEEKKPLGTAGSLKLIEKNLSDSFFLTNCDTLIDANYVDIMNYHKKNKFLITLVASSKDYIIPYGVCKLLKNGTLKEIDEKPKTNLLINIGLYILDPSIIKKIPNNKYYDMTQLIQKINKNKNKVGIYPIHDNSWKDIGQWDEYKSALEFNYLNE